MKAPLSCPPGHQEAHRGEGRAVHDVPGAEDEEVVAEGLPEGVLEDLEKHGERVIPYVYRVCKTLADTTYMDTLI